VLLCRTRRIDDAVRDAVQRGLPALVILGAGLDTRPYRLTELAGINVLELDLPQVQAFKKRRLSQFGALPPNVHFIPIDFNTQQLDDALAKGGVSPSERAIFV
jgi:methyltransferase (TIGR00027 family)